MPEPTHPLLLTGERTLPGVPEENYWFRRHEVLYRRAAKAMAGLDVLDAGSGEGYGTAILATTARRAVGVERDAAAHAYAVAAYPRAAFVRADVSALPLPDGCVDAAVSFQVIEHLPDVASFVDEVARVLRPGGLFWCATPNRLTFTPGSPTPVNPFHVVEFAPAELTAALAGRFSVERVRGVHHGRRIAALEAEHGSPLPALLLATPATDWPGWLSDVVAAVGTDDFTVTDARLEESLDLLAIARRPAA